MAAVLVVDDEPIVRDMVVRYLEREGFDTFHSGDGASALRVIENRRPDLVVLDVMLPGVDGLEVCRHVRGTSDVPIILLTARSEETDRIVGLELGADDYVTKPFSPRELVARVKAVLRRSRAAMPDGGVIEVAGLAIDAGSREVTRDGRHVRLTAKEFDLLWFFVTHPRLVFSREQLLDRVWGYRPEVDSGTVTVHIRRLRSKIEVDPARPAHLETVWGVGYRFRP